MRKKRRTKKLVMIFIISAAVFFLVLPKSHAAEEIPQMQEILNGTNLSEIEQFLSGEDKSISFGEIFKSFLKGERGLDINDLKKCLKNAFAGEIENCMLLVIKIVAIGILFSIVKELKTVAFEKSVGDAAFFVCYLLIAFVLSQMFLQALDIAKVIIQNINNFITMSMPLLMTFLVGSGAAKTAACVNPIILIGIEILSVLTSAFFIPLIFSLCMISIFSKISTNINLSSFAKTIKLVLKWSMGLVFSLFAGIVSIYGSLGASTDALSARAAKYVVGSAVPVVGPLLSETMGTFTYSCAIVKNAFGTTIICIIFVLMAAPAIKLFVIMLMVNISSALISPFADKRIYEAVYETGSAISYILGLVCLTAVLFIICIAVIIHTSNNVVV